MKKLIIKIIGLVLCLFIALSVITQLLDNITQMIPSVSFE